MLFKIQKSEKDKPQSLQEKTHLSTDYPRTKIRM